MRLQLQPQFAREITAARAALASASPSAIHEARKHLKRARSTLRLLRGAMAPESRRSLGASLRQVARQLAGTRDRQVMLGLLHTWQTFAPDPVVRQAAATLTREFADQPRQSTQSLQRRARADLAAIHAQLANCPPATLSRARLRKNLERSFRRAQRAQRAFEARRRLALLHVWRKRAKDLWYQLRAVDPWLRPRAKALTKRLRELTELQGQAHDLGVLRKHLRQGAGHLTAGERQACSRFLRTELTALTAKVLHLAGQFPEPPPSGWPQVVRKRPR